MVRSRGTASNLSSLYVVRPISTSRDRNKVGHMGRGKADAEIVKAIAQHARIQSERPPSPDLASEWRWSRSGWDCESLPNSLKSVVTPEGAADPLNTDETAKS